MILEVLPAKKGDCLMLHSESAEGPGMILIDGGPAGVYKNALLPRLMELRDERGLGEDEPLVLDLLIVSHVDDDHINGVIDLFDKMKRRRDLDRMPPLFEIRDLWHNSFDDVVGNGEVRNIGAGDGFGAASLGDFAEEEEAGSRQDAAMVLAGIAQGDKLRELAEDLEIPINGAFGNALIASGSGGSVTREIAGVTLTVIGPRKSELEKLERDFDRWLAEQQARRPTASDFLQGLDDKSVANLSSIVLLAEAGGRRILLTGDARSDYVLAGMEESGLLEAGGTLPVDVLKMPHHGSIRNLDDEGDFLRRVPARHYVFSGNGEHGNPDRETFDLLFKSRAGEAMDLYLTYGIDAIDPQRAHEHERERGKRRGRGKPEGPAWDEGANALAAVLAPPPDGVRVMQHDGAAMRI